MEEKNKWFHFIHEYLVDQGLSEINASYLNTFLLFVLLIALIALVDYVLWKVIRSATTRLARKTKTNFDNLMVANRLPRHLAHIFPLLLALELLPLVFYDFDYAGSIAMKVLYIIWVVVILRIIRSFLHTLKDYLKTLPRFKDKPIDSYIQVFMIFAWAAGIMGIIAIMFEVGLWKFFTGLGAASAVILLIFRDTILGFVASMQVSINDMVRIGDWITFEKYGADGDVIEITLATVKVQNFDKTITTIPTYALISESFKNWRGMQSSGGRRIKRAVIIKQQSIRFLTDEEVEALKKIELIRPYLSDRQQKIKAYNAEKEVDKSSLINGRNLTNLGVFRKYLETYLEHHSAINKEMTLMTRQLEPTPQGIPLEVYAFSSDKRWQNYEYIMADIFDHILAAVPYFSLEIFELPTSLKD
ncbi:MAG: mechanosensitive ion channel protein MscS [Muricauda sp.]|nr:mechanosensitive ion channel domain-containing protein [Allomuricauda sp.]MAU27248.1 mechanosensitive ion channel protein MscS [Allomuricauda sp.]MBC29969.1 mechanosensitive ion channel protein MscS [Allomuricauda sp.]|tara:strand:- start:92384 stop:93631 length:1248 start_codon:yes stop_codon:yes gene_type:complete